jgi:hypothetical protein
MYDISISARTTIVFDEVTPQLVLMCTSNIQPILHRCRVYPFCTSAASLEYNQEEDLVHFTTAPVIMHGPDHPRPPLPEVS